MAENLVKWKQNDADEQQKSVQLDKFNASFEKTQSKCRSDWHSVYVGINNMK